MLEEVFFQKGFLNNLSNLFQCMKAFCRSLVDWEFIKYYCQLKCYLPLQNCFINCYYYCICHPLYQVNCKGWFWNHCHLHSLLLSFAFLGYLGTLFQIESIIFINLKVNKNKSTMNYLFIDLFKLLGFADEGRYLVSSTFSFFLTLAKLKCMLPSGSMY